VENENCVCDRLPKEKESSKSQKEDSSILDIHEFCMDDHKFSWKFCQDCGMIYFKKEENNDEQI